MSDTVDDDFGIEIEDEQQVETPPAKPASKVVSTDDLQALLSKERSGREAAERRAAAAEQEARQARGAVSTEVEGRYAAEVQAVEAALRETASEIQRLEAEAEAADETGDRKAMMSALRKIARMEAQQLQAEGKRDWLRDNKDKIIAAAAPQKQAASGVDLRQFSPRQQDWIKKNDRYLTDADYRQQVARAHYAALGEGVVVDSDEYFSFVDGRVNGTARRVDPDPEQQHEASPFSEAAPQRPAPAAQMPAQRRLPNGQPPRGTIRLSAEEREAADIAFADMAPAERYKLYYEMKATNQ